MVAISQHLLNETKRLYEQVRPAHKVDCRLWNNPHAPHGSTPGPVTSPDPARAGDMGGPGRTSPQDAEIYIVGDLLAECIKQRRLAQLRLYLAMRLIDSQGSGIIYKDELRTALNGEIGKRYRNMVLKDGCGLFWSIETAHRRPVIKLVGTARLWAEIGTERVRGQSVRVTWGDLFGPGRSHFRQRMFELSRESLLSKGRPVTRRTIHNLIGVGRSTQRRYDKKNKTTIKQNIVIGEALSERSRQAARLAGRACFDFEDWGNKANQNRTNPRGWTTYEKYIAWWQGNSYQAAETLTEKSRKKRRRLNHQLTCLWKIRAGGQANDGNFERLFHDDISAAGAAYNRDATKDAIYLTADNQTYGFWGIFGGQDRTMLLMTREHLAGGK